MAHVCKPLTVHCLRLATEVADTDAKMKRHQFKKALTHQNGNFGFVTRPSRRKHRVLNVLYDTGKASDFSEDDKQKKTTELPENVCRSPASIRLYDNVPDLGGKGVFPFPEYPKWDPTAKIPTGPIPGCEHLPFSVVPAMWEHLAVKYGDLMAVTDAWHRPRNKFTYKEFNQHLRTFARGLQTLGIKQYEHVSMFGENSHRWLVVDQAVMLLGACDCVRGSDHTPLSELQFIVQNSESVAVFCESPELLVALMPWINELNKDRLQVRFAVCMWGDAPSSFPNLEEAPSCAVWSYNEVVEVGERTIAEEGEEWHPPQIRLTDIATMVYTSGTTGESPKEGVCLTHANLLYEMGNLGTVVEGKPGLTGLSLLPPWHIYERTSMYFRFSCGVHTVHTNVKHLRKDLKTHQPHYFCTVPLVLQTLANQALSKIKNLPGFMGWLARTLYNASLQYVLSRRIVMGVELDHAMTPFKFSEKAYHFCVMAVLWSVKQLADILVFKKIRDVVAIRRCAVSGGGSLAKGLDDFYEVIGIQVLNGWGLTETSPVLSARQYPPDHGDFAVNVRGTIGKPLPATEIMVVNPDTYEKNADGQRGLILVRGPQVMRSNLGYFGNKKANAASFPIGDEWFDTGDLGYICPDVKGSRMAGNLVLTGRQKDTIVLLNGENIEPEPIELACIQSNFIKQMMVIGQDQQHLSALVVPDYDYIMEMENVHRTGDWMHGEELLEAVTNEVTRLNKKRSSYKEDDRIFKIKLVEAPFSRDNGLLGNTMKMKRHMILERYADLVAELLK